MSGSKRRLQAWGVLGRREGGMRATTDPFVALSHAASRLHRMRPKICRSDAILALNKKGPMIYARASALPNARLHIGMLVACVRVRFPSPSPPPTNAAHAKGMRWRALEIERAEPRLWCLRRCWRQSASRTTLKRASRLVETGSERMETHNRNSES